MKPLNDNFLRAIAEVIALSAHPPSPIALSAFIPTACLSCPVASFDFDLFPNPDALRLSQTD